MKITLPHKEQLSPRRGAWAYQYWQILKTMPEAEIDTVPQEHITQWRYTLQLLVDDKRVAINTREYDNFNVPASSIFDLILDIQYNPARNWPSKIQPFVMFSRQMCDFHKNVERYREIISSNSKQYMIGWSGCHWYGRQYMIDGLKDCSDVFFRDNWTSCKRLSGRGQVDGRRFIGPDYEDYLRDDVSKWKWGLVMYGRGSNRSGTHNQREHEFAALGVPMIINYKPCYYVPFEPGKHYLLARQPGEVIALAGTLTDSDALDFKNNAYDYWKKHMSAEGICNLFRRICQEQL